MPSVKLFYLFESDHTHQHNSTIVNVAKEALAEEFLSYEELYLDKSCYILFLCLVQLVVFAMMNSSANVSNSIVKVTN